MREPLYIFSGPVENGAGRGKNLGFPTANIKLEKQIPEGIYASQVLIDGGTYIGATFIGAAITFGETEYKSETYLLDYSDQLYGKKLRISLYKKLRGNKKFDSEKELIDQMSKDIVEINNYFK